MGGRAEVVGLWLTGGSRGIDVEGWDEHPPLVRGYYDALSRALTNVVINAIEAGNDGALIVITVRRKSIRGREMIEIGVQDSGPGITPERLATIWEPYVTSKPGGTGLGLAIVRQTILAHHGLVSASSTAGAGTEVALALPIDGDPAEIVEPAGEED